MIKNNNKGFTLIELLVVVLIIGILAAMAMPQYFKAVERSRMSEALTLLGNIAQAQQRKYLQINKYTENYKGLDVAPKGATGDTYHTKTTTDKAGKAAAGNGFAVVIDGTTFTAGKVTATREAQTGGTLQYKYNLSRYYANSGTACQGTDDNGAALCADFCGIDEMTTNNYCCSDGSTAEKGVAKDKLTGTCATPVAND